MFCDESWNPIHFGVRMAKVKVTSRKSTSDIARRQHLRSAGCRQLLVPRHRRSMFGRRAFSVAGSAAWNSLPDYLWDAIRSVHSFRRDVKTFLFSFYSRTQRIRGFAIMRYNYKSTIDIDIAVVAILWELASTLVPCCNASQHKPC